MSDTSKSTKDLSNFEGQTIHGESIEGGASFTHVNIQHSEPHSHGFAHTNSPNTFGSGDIAGGNHITPGEMGNNGGAHTGTDHVIGSAIPSPLDLGGVQDSVV